MQPVVGLGEMGRHRSS